MGSDTIKQRLHDDILVVEDNTSDLKLISDFLTNAGYHVRPASDGELALRSVAARPPDLILLDVNLPGMNGVEVCRRLKADSTTKDIPVIFISALGKTDLKVKALEAGGTDYVTKPIETTEVLTRINIHLNMHWLQLKLTNQSEKLSREIEERKKAEKELVKHRDHLEDLVKQRTIELQQKIVEQKRTEKKFRESEEKFRVLYDNSPDMYVSVSPEDASILLCNKTLLEKTGYSKEDIIGTPIFKMYHDDCLEEVKKIFKQFVETGIVQSTELIMKRKNGSKIDVSLNVNSVRDKAGKILYSISSWRDITDQKKLEDRLQQAQKMESIGTLAGGIAHDFNNILFPILGHTEMLLEDVSKESPFRASLDQIYIASIRASDLVKQILTFSRQESGELKRMKVQPIIKEALKLVRSTIPTTINIKQNINPSGGIIKADPTQIHQIIMNLATNSYHAMEKTGGELKVCFKEVELGTHDEKPFDIIPGTYACLTITDTGVGMDKNLTDKIFYPFFTTKKKGRGTGMGLSVVHGIVKKMNGAIKVYSEPGKGAEFKVYFPIEKNFFERQDILNKESIQSGTEKILLVDDEEAILKMEKRMLERLGYKVTSRISSIEALDLFRAGPDKFDMVITDMAMPHLPGDKLVIELIKIQRDIPILLCTGFSENISEEKNASLGIKGFLLKPIRMKVLAQKVREVLDGK